MSAELKLTKLEGTISHYSIVTIVFFATYIVFQPPATVIVRYLGPRNFLSVIVVAWGAVMIGMGFADSAYLLCGMCVEHRLTSCVYGQATELWLHSESFWAY